jgi:hypothetical protein
MKQGRSVYLSESTARDLQNLSGNLENYVEARLGAGESQNPTREKQIRVAKIVSNDFAVPSGNSCRFEIQFGTPDFDNTTVGGSGECVDFEPYKGSADTIYRIASCIQPSSFDEGDLVYVGLMHGKWYILQGVGGNANEIIFAIDEVYTSDEGGEHCDDKKRDAKEFYKAKVLHHSCGSNVPGMDEEGYVEVHDELGSFLKDREEYEVVGKIGVAHYFTTDPDESYYDDDCKWIITWIDWFREVQVITNVILTEDSLKFELKNVQVWDDCELDPIEIPLIDCE